jgi:trk system potassium uptake protein TrkH
MYVFIFLVSVFIISFDKFDFVTNFSAVAATFNNIGPGLGAVGPVCNYSEYSDLSKIILTIDMLAGRLEILPMMILLLPKTWYGNN